METEFLYRYEEIITAPLLDEHETPIANTASLKLYCKQYAIIRRTPKGAWIDMGFGFKKFVKLTAFKRYACSTKEDAWLSFRARKERQIAILSSQLRRARGALKLDPASAVDLLRDSLSFS